MIDGKSPLSLGEGPGVRAQWRLLLIALVVFTQPLLAQDTLQIDTSLLLSTATVTAARQNVDVAEAFHVETIAQAEIERVQPLSTADILQEIPGVYVQKSQLGGGSPILRGFEANRVLLIVDGVRMNNSIYRGGHLQNAITIDPDALEQVSVGFGPGALRYGSDALGGVINLKTEALEFRNSGSVFGGGAGLRVSSAATSTVATATLRYSSQRFVSLTRFSVANYGDLRAGATRTLAFQGFGFRLGYVDQTADGRDTVVTNERVNVQVGSGYHQLNLLQKFGWRFDDQHHLTANLQFSTTGDVPRYDALVETRNLRPRWARWDYGPQTRALAALVYESSGTATWHDHLRISLNQQFIEEDRFRRRFNDPLTEESRVDVHITGLNGRAFKELSSKDLLEYGLDLRRETVEATATFDPRYPGGGNSLVAGSAFFKLDREWNSRWSAQVGGRYTYQRLRSVFTNEGTVSWPATYLAGITNNSGALTGAASLQYAQENHRLRLIFAQGFRAPNFDDFAKFREQDGRIQVPNPDLRPERSNSVELNAERQLMDGRINLFAAAHHAWLSDAVVRRSGALPDGRTFFFSRGDSLLVQQNFNVQSARIYGLDARATARLTKLLSFGSEYHFLRGRRGNGLPQDHIPPPFGSSWVTLDRGPFQVRYQLNYQLRKDPTDYAVSGFLADGTPDRTGTSDNLELTPNQAGSPSWWTVSTYLDWRPEDSPFSLGFRVENMLDIHYRTFGSGISAPGIDIGLSLKVDW